MSEEEKEQSLLADLQDAFAETIDEMEKGTLKTESTETDETGSEEKKEETKEETKSESDATGTGDTDPEAAWKEAVGNLPEEIRDAIGGLSGQQVRDTFIKWDKERADTIAERDKHATDLKEAQEALGAFASIFEPFQDALTNAGVSSAQYTAALVKTKQDLDANPQATLKKLAQQYGVDLSSGDAKTGDEDDKSSDNSEIGKLRQEVEQLKAKDQERTAAIKRETQADVKSALQAFAEEKGDDGKAKYPHFEDARVQKIMASVLETETAETLADAYDMAVNAVPELREKVMADTIAKREREAEEKRQAELKKAAKEAERSTSSRGTDDASTDAEAKKKEEPTLEDDLAEALREQASRSAA